MVVVLALTLDHAYVAVSLNSVVMGAASRFPTVLSEADIEAPPDRLIALPHLLLEPFQ